MQVVNEKSKISKDVNQKIKNLRFSKRLIALQDAKLIDYLNNFKKLRCLIQISAIILDKKIIEVVLTMKDLILEIDPAAEEMEEDSA